MISLRFLTVWRSLAWLQVIIVITLSLIPNPPTPPGPLASDKIQHFLAYAWLAGWVRQCFEPKWIWLGLLVGMGVILEFLQGLGGVRTLDLVDAVYNSLGVLIGFVLCRWTPLGRLLAGFEQSIVIPIFRSR